MDFSVCNVKNNIWSVKIVCAWILVDLSVHVVWVQTG